MGYVVHIEIGVTDGFFPIPALFLIEFPLMGLGDYLVCWAFLTAILLSLTEKL